MPNEGETNDSDNQGDQGAGPAQGATTDPNAEVARLRDELAKARKWEDRAKANGAAAKELEELRLKSMNETEKAVASAKSEGRKEALVAMGARLVDAEVKAAAAGRNVNVDVLLEGLDRSRFLGDDGEPDAKAIKAWVEKLAPAGQRPGFPDLGQGARGAPTGADDMNALLRRGAGR